MNNVNIKRFAPLSYAGQEAINTLCTNLSFAGADMKKIMVTSSHPAEGKSFLSMNIMRTIASFGKKIVLIEADLRRSRISSRYGLSFDTEDPKGLAHYLAGISDINEILYRTNIPNAFIIPAGRNVSNPMTLLNSSYFEKLLNQLTAVADYIVVDVPPILSVIDAAEIAKYCDGTVLVVSYNSVSKQDLIAAKDQLEQTGCPIIGTVLNQVDDESYFTKRYYYGDTDPVSTKKGKYSR